MAKALTIHAVNAGGLLAENAPLMLHTRLEELYKFAPFIHDPANVAELHNMRIAAKRLRYTLELFAPVLRSRDFDTFYEQVKDIQERIGEIHDADVRGPLLTEFVQKHGGKRPEIRGGLETLARSQQSERAKLYTGFLVFWNKLQAKGFRRRFLQMLIQPELAPPPQETPANDGTHPA